MARNSGSHSQIPFAYKIASMHVVLYKHWRQYSPVPGSLPGPGQQFGHEMVQRQDWQMLEGFKGKAGSVEI